MPEPEADDVEAAREALRRASANRPFQRKRPKSKTAKLRELRPEIAKRRTEGWTWQEIADALRGTLDASPDMIRLAIATTKKTAGRIKAKPAAPNVPAGPAHRRDPVVSTTPEPSVAKKKRHGPPEL